MKKSNEKTPMKKVLVVTYYWVPAGGSGVQRWLHMTKYLSSAGWKPSIFAPENAKYQVYDYDLAQEVGAGIEVHTCKLRDAAALYNTLFGKSKKHTIGQGMTTSNKKKSIIQRIAFWLRGNLFIPDPRITWVKPSVKKILQLIENEKFDAIITTGPPHSVHLIGKRVKEKTGIFWLADFRDPWSKIDYLEQLSPGKRAMRIIRKLEREVLTNADVVCTIGKTLSEELITLGARKVQIVENGFDADILQRTNNDAKAEEFVISHTGVLPNSRNPHTLWDVLALKVKNDPVFAAKMRIVLAGKVDEAVIQCITDKGLSSNLIVKGMVNHAAAIHIQQSSSLLLLVVNDAVNAKGIVTGKVFEYMANRRPILAIGPPDGDLSEILNRNNSVVYDYSDFEGMQRVVDVTFAKWNSGVAIVEEYPYFMEYSRENLAKKIARILSREE